MIGYSSYILCTSPRSGSTLLCKLLAATGVSGHPGSYFHKPSKEDWLEDLNVDVVPGENEQATLRRIFAAAIEKGTRGKGLFGLRLQRHSFDFFMKQLAVLYPDGSSDLTRLEAVFGKTLFVHLTRADKVDQAVSFVRAEQSGLWHRAPDGTELERLSEPRELQYDAAEIRACHDRFTRFDRDWQAWFEIQGISPLRITYDALSADPQATLRLVLQRLGLEASAAEGVVPSVAKLADATNADWVSRFRAELEIDSAS
ncbi:sulfotransferase [Labrenzia sp. CP4]|jgi:LPS sulfotransferase NodH|uniref:Stf0 family sulfotransferase n=1 Tax=Labrenzia sp. CP4 TaxID=1674922 RepID=UPI000784E5A0|nr:Stf0 family sulfotransferase [Labrenzia sp. CP4]AMN54869.1 sulfotransferase [Labrenzia sp. CP4]